MRKQLLASAVPYYQDFVKQQSDDPELEAERGLAYHRLAYVRAEMGEKEEALADSREMAAIFARLEAAFPDQLNYRQELAHSHHNLGFLLAGLGRRDEAEKEYLAALALQEKLVKQFPALTAYRQDLAGSHKNLGSLLRNLDRRDEAEKEFLAALAVQEKLIEQFPAVPDYRRDLANSHNALGNLLVGLGRRAEAEKECRAALALQEKLAEQFPAVPDYAEELGGGYCNFGILVRDQGQPEAALPWYDKAIARLQTVLAKDRRLAKARLFLRNAHWGRAVALTRLNRHAESIRDWGQAIEFDEGPLRNVFRLQRAGCLAQTGEHARAVAEANALTEGNGVPGPTLYDAACVCALAAVSVKDDAKLSEQYAGRAVALLRQAQKAGFFKQPANVAHMKKDSDLRALRARPDYRDLLKELETPARP